MKKLIICSLVAASFFACGTKNNDAYRGDTEVTIPCSGDEFKSNKQAFRAWAEGYSTDMTIARNKALTMARAELATQVSATLKRVTDSYGSSYQTGMDEEAKTRFQDLVRVAVDQKLVGTRVICNKLMRTRDNKFRAYVVVELTTDDLATEITNKVSAEDKIRTDYEYEKFKEVFDKEMSNMNK